MIFSLSHCLCPCFASLLLFIPGPALQLNTNCSFGMPRWGMLLVFSFAIWFCSANSRTTSVFTRKIALKQGCAHVKLTKPFNKSRATEFQVFSLIWACSFFFAVGWPFASLGFFACCALAVPALPGVKAAESRRTCQMDFLAHLPNPLKKKRSVPKGKCYKVRKNYISPGGGNGGGSASGWGNSKNVTTFKKWGELCLCIDALCTNMVPPIFNIFTPFLNFPY